MATLKKSVEIIGHGIHSGAAVRMVVHPSKAHGIFFNRVDMPGTGPIAVTYDNVGETKMRNTTIGDVKSAHVQTIEHLMAALFIAGIDSAVIDIDGPETPILDGSAAEFYKDFIDAGVTRGNMKKIVVRRTVVAHAAEVRRGMNIFSRIKWWLINTVSGRKSNGYVKLEPGDGKTLDITATLIYPEKIIGAQTFSFKFDGTKKSVDAFVRDIARARTFGKYSEWEYLKKHGMARGANENNVIALNNSGDGTLNKTIWPDEFVRHKIIDAIGDMNTSGGFIVGKLTSFKGSHALNNLVLKKLFSNPENYDIIGSK